jgi:enediyne biosynthesis protein E4
MRVAIALGLLACACSEADPQAGEGAGSLGTVSGSDVCYAGTAVGEGSDVSFRDTTEALGLEAPLAGMLGHAVAVGDVNRDAWTDVFVGGFADRPLDEYQNAGVERPPPDRLLLGGPDGFRTDESFPGARGRTSGAAFADLDGDADLDLVVARNRRDVPRGRAPSVVLRNDGTGHFTIASELPDPAGARSVGVLDADGDGRLDLVIVGDRFTDESTTMLFHNEGDLDFEDRTEEAGLPSALFGLGVTTVDLNQDGAPDIFIGGSNSLFVNEGAGTFREVDAGLTWETYGPEDDPAGVAAGDLNADGLPDLVVGQHYNSTLDDERRVPVRVYLNDGTDSSGTPRLRDVTEEAGLPGLPTKAPHVEIVDLDADGRPDILTSASAGEGNVPAVFRNVGVDGGVPRFVAPSGLGSPIYWVTGAVFDADHDGRLDVLLVDFDPRRGSRLLSYTGPSGHWIGVQVGPAGSSGVGTGVEVYEVGGLDDPSQRLGTQWITASAGFGSGSLPAARLGLDSVASVDVRVQRTGDPPIALRDVPADRLLEVAGGRSCVIRP